MWILRTLGILWAGFIISTLAVLIAPGLYSGFFSLAVMSGALLMSAREVYRADERN